MNAAARSILLLALGMGSRISRNLLPDGNRDDRRALLVSGVSEREEKHDKRKKFLGSEIFVIDPVPIFPIGHSGKGIVGSLRRAANPHERRNGDAVHSLRRRGLKRALLLHVGGR